MSGSSDLPRAGQSDDFATTQWSVVLRAVGPRDAAGSAALADLCRSYWYPLYAYVRRRTAQAAEAQDLTQAFFAELLEHEKLAAAAPERGKFRAFLLTALRHFLINAHERETAQKRGGGAAKLSLDFQAGESRWNLEPATAETPERIFEREWTLALLAEVLQRLRAEYEAVGKMALFDALQPTLAGGVGAASFAEIGAQLHLSEDAARQAALRLRRRYREQLRAEVSRTVADPSDVDDEILGLFETLGP